MFAGSLLEYLKGLMEEPDAVTMQVYRQQTSIREDKLKWLVRQLYQVMSLELRW